MKDYIEKFCRPAINYDFETVSVTSEKAVLVFRIYESERKPVFRLYDVKKKIGKKLIYELQIKVYRQVKKSVKY